MVKMTTIMTEAVVTGEGLLMLLRYIVASYWSYFLGGQIPEMVPFSLSQYSVQLTWEVVLVQDPITDS